MARAKDETPRDDGRIGRRKLIAALGLGAGGAALLPRSWKKPIADMVEVPLYAQGSPPPSPPPDGGIE